MGIYQARLTMTASSGKAVIHRLNVVGADLAAAKAAASAIATYYQPVSALQLTSITINDEAVSFNQLRGSPAGVLQNRLYLTYTTTSPTTGNRPPKLQLAISDPISTVKNYLLGLSTQKPSEWSDFETHVLGEIRTPGGCTYSTLTKATFASHARSADEQEPITRFSGSEWEIKVTTHQTTHLSNGNDAIHYTRTQTVGANAMRASGALAGNDGAFVDYGLSPTSTTSVLMVFHLPDYVSGNIAITWSYTHATGSSGNIVMKLEASSKADGGSTAVEETLNATITVPQNTNVHYHTAWALSSANIARGDILGIRLYRMGADSGDTCTNYTQLISFSISYLADLAVPV